MEIFILLTVLGLVAGFLSGLLGIGGGIILAPLLLYLPPLFNIDPLSMHTVAGLTIVQSLVACISGAITHRKYRYVSGKLMFWMGGIIFISALTGGAAAVFFDNRILLAIFALLALVAAGLIFFPTRADSEKPDVNNFTFSRMRAVAASCSVGFLGGLVGQGGSFILIPLMTSYLQVPTRIAIGSNLAIVLLSSLAAFMGKAFTGQIDWLLALPIVLVVVPAAHFGGLVSQRVPVATLRRMLAVIIALAAIRIGISSLGF